jgi:hypothetical protein
MDSRAAADRDPWPGEVVCTVQGRRLVAWCKRLDDKRTAPGGPGKRPSPVKNLSQRLRARIFHPQEAEEGARSDTLPSPQRPPAPGSTDGGASRLGCLVEPGLLA